MQTASSRIWNLVTVSTSFDDNRYTMNALSYVNKDHNFRKWFHFFELGRQLNLTFYNVTENQVFFVQGFLDALTIIHECSNGIFASFYIENLKKNLWDVFPYFSSFLTDI